ncbi:MAG: F0F1 ATP synthase subunit A [Alphaproteobacteria bacterium]|nr:F0F1 ATP synthase subunit A [Alphaproteobacteria bacterium]
MAESLFEEFEIHHLSDPLFSIGGHPVTFTNSALWMFISIIVATMLMVVTMRRQAMVPGRWQMMTESFHNMIANLVRDMAGEHAKPFFPFIFTIFAFIFFSNLLGLIPHSLAVTSHIIVNFGIAIMLFIVITITGFIRQGFHFFGIFVPPGVPKIMLPVIVPIEMISFAVRPFSLSIRLFANMLAGHLVLLVFAGLTASLVAAKWLAGLSVLPLGMNIAITGFEFFVAFIQAYVYTILSALYLRDALEGH